MVTAAPDTTLLDQLDLPVTQVAVDPGMALLHREMLKQYLAEPKKPVMIATPDNWKEPQPYAEFYMLNGVGFIVKADEVVMVPESLKMLMDDNKATKRDLNKQEEEARRKLRYTSIDQVPEWIH